MELEGASRAAYLTSLFWGTLTLGRFIGILISSRLKPSFMLCFDIVGCLISLGIIMLWPESSMAIWIGTFLMGLSEISMPDIKKLRKLIEKVKTNEIETGGK